MQFPSNKKEKVESLKGYRTEIYTEKKLFVIYPSGWCLNQLIDLGFKTDIHWKGADVG